MKTTKRQERKERLRQELKEDPYSLERAIRFFEALEPSDAEELKYYCFGNVGSYDYELGWGLEKLLLAVINSPAITSETLDDMFAYWEDYFHNGDLLKVARAIARHPKTSSYITALYDLEIANHSSD